MNAHEDPYKKHSICAPLICVNALKAAQHSRMERNNNSSQIGTFTTFIRSLWKVNALSSVGLSVCLSAQRGSHVSTTHDAIDKLEVTQVCPPPP